MKKNILVLYAVVIVAVIVHQSIGLGQVKAPLTNLVAPALPQIAVSQKTVKAMSRQDIITHLTPNLFDSGRAWNTGIAQAAFDIKTGEIRFAGIGDSSNGAYAGASFQGPALQNVGSSTLKGVTITATFQVINVMRQGNVQIFCAVDHSTTIMGADVSEAAVQGPGTFKVTSAPVDIPPGATYTFRAYIFGGAGTNTPMGLYAKVLSIDMN